LKYLFCSYDHIWVIDIPNTTNALEWVFGHLKGKVSLHRGLKKERKIKLILSLSFIENSNYSPATHFLPLSRYWN
jgi:hypothetical protein